MFHMSAFPAGLKGYGGICDEHIMCKGSVSPDGGWGEGRVERLPDCFPHWIAGVWRCEEGLHLASGNELQVLHPCVRFHESSLNNC
jgi:hypothetical protein